jgi:hypothetical protein
MSITLTNAASLSLNGASAESDANAAAVAMEAVFPNTVIVTLNYGATAGQTFTSGTRIRSVIVTVNLVTGGWSADNGTSGTLGAGALTAFKSTVTGWRNATETFVVNNNIIIGSQVAWT